jgi:hypothetical protein
LTAEQIKPISEALMSHSLTVAIDRYREAVPDAGLTEARQYVFGLYRSLRRQDPEKFAPPPLSLATLNWRGFAICALIEAAVVGIWWLLMPPAHPASFVSQFAYSLLLGMGLLAGGRVKSRTAKLLLLVPSITLLILSETIVPRLSAAASHSIGTYLCGFFFGIALTASAFLNPRLRKQA